jgi:signal transduction histidine kinase
VFRIYSMKGLLLGHNLAFLLLIVVTGAMGLLGVELRQRAAEETQRLSSLVNLVQETRGDVYRQMTEVFDHHFLAAPRAAPEYGATGSRIAANFAKMEAVAIHPAEAAAIEGLQLAFEQVRQQTDLIMTTPSSAFREADHLTVFFTADLEMVWLEDYERVFAANDELMSIAQNAEENRVARLSRTASLILLIPIALAGGLLLVSRVFVQQAFVRPVNALLAGVAAFGRGRLDHKVQESGATELVTLQRAVNRMSEDLALSREALVRSEKQAALGSLVPVVAHNIRNPLASIRATAQVHDSPDIAPDVGQGLKDIRVTVDRLEQWLSSLLSYLNPLRLARSHVHLADVAATAIDLLAPRIDGKSLTVERIGWDGLSDVTVDIHLMEQAVVGLLSNAIEASPDKGVISVSIKTPENSVQLVIADQGPGMPFRPAPGELSPGPTTKSYGSGLGIPFAFKICDLHHGTIDFEPGTDGGTDVIVTLPASEAKRSAA